MTKVLILHSKTAGGHVSAAEAIAEELKTTDKNLQIVIKDILEQTNFGFKINPSTSYALLSGPLLPLFNLLYLLTNTAVGIKALRFLIKLGWGYQFKKLIEEVNPDLIVTTHHFISPSTIYSLPKKSPFVTIVTDLGKPHRIWFDKKIDKIITPTQETAEHGKTISRSDNEQIIHLGYPLKKIFKVSIKKKFKNAIMIIGGGSGAGRMQKQLDLLLQKLPNKKLIVVCGFNKNLYKKIAQIQNPQLKVYQFVDNLHRLMSSSDIIISKAGPGTIMEAASLKKPLIITSWVGHQEKDNIDFVINNRLGVYCPNLNKLADCVNSVYQNYSRYENSKNWYGSKIIAQYLKKEILQL